MAHIAPADYTSAEHYAREVDLVLATGWLPLCRADQLSTFRRPDRHRTAGPTTARCPRRRCDQSVRQRMRASRFDARRRRCGCRVDARLPLPPVGLSVGWLADRGSADRGRRSRGRRSRGRLSSGRAPRLVAGFRARQPLGNGGRPAQHVRRSVGSHRTVALVGDGDGRLEPVRIDVELEDHGRELDRVLSPHRRPPRLRRTVPAGADHRTDTQWRSAVGRNDSRHPRRRGGSGR